MKTQNNANPAGFLVNKTGLDTSRYQYIACNVRGNCLSTRPNGPVFDNDKIIMRQMVNWWDPASEDCVTKHLGKLVAVVTNDQRMIKELTQADLVTGFLWLWQYNPGHQSFVQFMDIRYLFLVDEVQHNAVIISPETSESLL